MDGLSGETHEEMKLVLFQFLFERLNKNTVNRTKDASWSSTDRSLIHPLGGEGRGGRNAPKVNINISLCLIKHHDMKTCEEG
jgi:hypothetical protein